MKELCTDITCQITVKNLVKLYKHNIVFTTCEEVRKAVLVNEFLAEKPTTLVTQLSACV